MKSKPACFSFAALLHHVLFLCSLLLTGEGLAQELWVTDGPVFATAQSGNTLYAGGFFDNVGPATGAFAVSDPATGVAQSGWARVTGEIRTILPDGSGGWYIGGDITQVGTFVRKNIAHIRADKTVDPDFAPDADNAVLTMARSGNVLYVGGDFTFIGGKIRSYLAAIDATTGAATDWNPDLNDSVRALVINSTNSVLYVGGDFNGANSFGGQLRNRLAAVNIPAGTLRDWNPGATGSVNALSLLSDTALIVGGGFNGLNSLAGASRDYLGRVHATTGVINAWNPDPNGPVYSLASILGAMIVVGGNFTHIGAVARGKAAVISSAGVLSPWNPGANASVNAIAVSGSTLFLGGDFLSVTGGASQRGIAAYDIPSASLTAFNPSLGGGVSAIASNGTSIAFGGDVFSTGMVSRKAFAAFDLTTGAATSLDVPVTGTILAILPIGDMIYIGGNFESIGGQLRSSLAAIDSAGTVQAFDGNVIGETWALKSSGNTLYVCGAFNSVLGNVRNNLAAIDTSTGTLTGWNPNANSACLSLAIDTDGTVYAGGDFTLFPGPVIRTYAAAFDSAGAVKSWNPSPVSSVTAILIDGDYIYTGGAFPAIGGKPRRFLAQFNRSDGSLTDWDPQSNSVVQTLAAFNGKIIAGGHFSTIGQGVRYGIAALDPVTGLADQWNPLFLPPVIMTVNASSDRVFAGGFFTRTDSAPLAYLANVTPLINTAAPAAPAGTAKDGETLSQVDSGTWSGFGTQTVSARQWQRCSASGAGCYDISGQTGTSYVLGPLDAGNRVRIYVTVDDDLMSEEAGGTPSAIIAPKNSKLPKIKGKARARTTLSASAGSWNGVEELTISYQWRRCGKTCKNIKNAKKNKYKVGSKDVGKKLLVIVSASKNGSAKSPAVSKKTKKVTW